MKIFNRIVVFNIVWIFFLPIFAGFAADKKEYSALPPAALSKKWRIGYLEGGYYKDYPKILIAMIRGLAVLGWIEPVSIPYKESDENTEKLWTWLAENIKSKYLIFAPDTYYSNNWRNELRENNKSLILKRLNESKDIDLMIAMGTWAGQDLASNEHSIPTMVCSVSNAITSNIVKSVKDSGYDHVHVRLDPGRYERQIRAFHDIIGFKNLGVTFEDSVEGRSYAAIGDIEKVAEEKQFEVVKCYATTHNVSVEEVESQLIKCAYELSNKIDAFYVSIDIGITSKSLPKILEAMNAKKIPTFSQTGSDEVQKGVLLSISSKDMTLLGKFHAETMGKIINGAKPRDLNQVFEMPVKIAFNKTTAKSINLKDDIYQLLLKTADEIYETTEKAK